MNLVNACKELYELFNTVADVSWNQTSDTFEGSFNINEDEIKIFVRLKQINDINLGIVSFTKNGSYAIEKTSKNSSKIIGAVFNALRSFFRQHQEIDAFLFSAKDAVEKRMSIYNSLAQDIAKTAGAYFYHDNAETIWTFTVVSRKPIDLSLITEVN